MRAVRRAQDLADQSGFSDARPAGHSAHGGPIEVGATANLCVFDPAALDPVDDVACVLYLRTLRTHADELHAEAQKIVDASLAEG